jgi:hypothetical protein
LGLIPKEVREELGTIDRAYCALPSYVGSFKTLTLFSGPNPGYAFSDVSTYLKSIDKHIYRLKLPKNVQGANINDIFNAKVTPDTHPGLVTRRFATSVMRKMMGDIKHVKKQHLIMYTVNDLIANWENISEGRVGRTVGTYCIGSREKIQKVDIGEACEARPLWIPEMCDLILGSTWLEVLKTEWQKYGVFDSEIWLGHSDTSMRYYRRIESDAKYKYD